MPQSTVHRDLPYPESRVPRLASLDAQPLRHYALRLMETKPFEALRARLEEQLRADVELLHEAHRVKLRAFETVWRAQADVEQMAQMPAPPAVDWLPAAKAPASPGKTESRRPG